MFIIAIEDVEFFAYHGYYPEEHILGNRYVVSVWVELPDKHYVVEDLGSTLNYENLFFTVKKVMDKPYQLLESIAGDIHLETLKLSSHIYSIDVKIKKINPPIPGMRGNSVVQLKKIYNESV